MRWNLDKLYSSFESEKYKKDMEKCDEIINSIKDWAENNLNEKMDPLKTMEKGIKLLIDFYTVYNLLQTYGYLKLSVNARNQEARNSIELLETKKVDLTKPLVSFKKWLGDLPDLDKIVNNSTLLKEHEFYIKELARDKKYLLTEKEEEIIAEMKRTGSKAWEKLQQVLTSTLEVEIEVEGKKKKLPLPVVRNMAYDADAEKRKRAYKAELAAYDKIKEGTASALNGIKGEVLTVCKLRGYKSPLEKTLKDSRLDSMTLDAMFQAIEEKLSSFQKYYRAKARLLGKDNGLPFYDLFAPVGDSNKKFTCQKAQDFIVKNFRTFSDKLADFAQMAFEEKWIDAEPRDGKTGGAFCYNIHPIGESRILSNFTGSFSDVLTLAHELGHGYHGHCLREESILNADYPMPLAETASIFCETIVENAALKEVEGKEKLFILETSLAGAGQVIVDIYSRFLFEREVFNRRKKSSLSVDELKEIMIWAQRKAYGNGLDHNHLHPYMWICKPHYYSGELNYYNFPYAFGLLFGKGLYAEYLESGEAFVAEYDNLLALTGKRMVADVPELMGINVKSKEFWQKSLEILEEDINEFVDLSQS